MYRVIDIATDEIGYLEKASNKYLDDKTKNAGSGNYTKYWRDLKPSYQGQAWCNCFVNWCFWKAYGANAKSVLYTDSEWSYYTPTSASYFQKKSAWYTKPEKGDVIYFKNSVRIHHVGIVVDVDDKYVHTIEGNTSSAEEVVPNGGGVYRKKYLLTNSKIAGYGRPDYSIVSQKDGWVKCTGGKWQFVENGSLVKGWKVVNHHWYYFGNDGTMLTGWQEINNEWFYLEGSGDFEGACWHEADKRNGSLERWYVDQA